MAIVWALALASVLMLVGAVAAVVVEQATLRMRVASVADLAALAGAQDPGDACTAAGGVVAANDLALIDCTLDGTDVVVTVSAQHAEAAARLLATLGMDARAVSATMRAGPP